MTWKIVTSINDLNILLENSKISPQYIFKHSNRCGVSTMAKKKIERENQQLKLELFLLDVIVNRDVSNEIEQKTGVKHESPQLIVLKNKQVIYHGSHSAIELIKYD